jgi:hypothetical protein
MIILIKIYKFIKGIFKYNPDDEINKNRYDYMIGKLK